jgi:hypothetical protein
VRPSLALATLSLSFVLVATPAAALLPGESAQPRRLGEYEWAGPAPIVIVGLSRGPDGLVEEFVVERMLRGELAPGDVVRVRLRRANRELSENSPYERLHVEPGENYVLLLEPGRRRGGRLEYDLTRGVLGARALPHEGAPALIAALERFIEMHRRNDHDYTWAELRAMLDEDEALYAGTAVEQFLKFRRGDPTLLPRLGVLLDHPDPALREASAKLVGSILERHPHEVVDEASGVRAELVARARRDEVIDVRIAATEALDELHGAAIGDVLEEIARDDPDQHVRLTAERLLWERRREARRNGVAAETPDEARPAEPH